MSEPEADEEEVDHRRELLSCAVLPDDRSGGPDSEYPVGLFHAPYGARIQKVDWWLQSRSNLGIGQWPRELSLRKP